MTGPQLFTGRGISVDLGGRKILISIDIELPVKEITALAGPSGAGKSTLLKALAGLVPLASGQVALGKEVLWPGNEKRLHQVVQPLFQDPGNSLNPRKKVSRIIEQGLKNSRDRKARVMHLLEQVGLEPDLANRIPGQLSGGQRQRVAWARALAPEPAVLLLDEPFAALDQPLRFGLVETIRTLAQQGMAILLVTHNLHDLAGIADRLGIMSEGRFVEWGKPDQIMAEPQHTVTRMLVENC